MRGLEKGEVAPHFILTDIKNGPFDLFSDGVAGRFVVLVFCRSDPLATAELEKFLHLQAAFDEIGARIVPVVSNKAVLDRTTFDNPLPFTVLPQATAELFEAYGIAYENNIEPSTTTVVLRPNGHVLRIVNDGSQAEEALEAIVDCCTSISGSPTGPHPPVLIVPDVLSAADCDQLIAAYEASKVPFIQVNEIKDQLSNVKTRVPDYGRQDRIDLMLNDGEVKDLVIRRLQARLLPEIEKAFQYKVTSLEGLRIAKYEGMRGGKSHGHRDNSEPEVAHRRFAVSINLNADDFQGGELRFPEFSDCRYKPTSGAAIVFSCSLLHEALQVEQGARYVLLVFLFGDR